MASVKPQNQLLAASGVTVGYGRKEVLSGLSFSLSAGKVTALLGRNGVGKSTLIKTVTRELPLIGGRLTVAGREPSEYTRAEYARILSIVTTDSVDSSGLRVKELVALGRHPYTGITGRLGTEDKKIVSEAISAVGIEHMKDESVGNLSDGERQKAMIARALAQQTPLMLLDEPFSFLDAASRIELLILLRRLALAHSKAVLFSSHDVHQALRMADDIWLLTHDRQLLCGTPSELISCGALDMLFANKGVRFDAGECDFLPSDPAFETYPKKHL